MKKRMIAMFLAVTMIFTILPANAFAADGRSAVPEGQETDDRPGSIKEWLEQNRGLDGEADVPEHGETPSHLTPRSIEAPVLSGKIEASPLTGIDEAAPEGRYLTPSEDLLAAQELWDAETSPDVSGWSFVDSDGDGHTWKWIAAEDSTSMVCGGAGMIVSSSYDDRRGSLHPDNWAVTPAFSLSGASEAFFSFFAKGQDPSWAGEIFAVYAGTSPDVESMTKLSQDRTATGEWTRYTASLADFLGQETVYAAVRHYNSDQFMLDLCLPQILRGVSAPGSGDCGDDLTWSYDSKSGVLTIAGSGSMTAYDSVNAVPWYPNRKAITELVLPEGMTGISDYAFFGTSALTHVKLPSTLLSIGYAAFGGSGVKDILLPAGVNTIREMAFRDCDSLTAFTAAEDNQSFQSIDGVLYSKDGTALVCWPCGKDGDFTISEDVTAIKEGAFAGAKGLSSVTIPDAVTSIGAYAFDGCKGLLSARLPESLQLIPRFAFGCCSGLAAIDIPDSVESIDYAAFYQCSALSSVSLGSGIKSLGDFAFAECANLAEITLIRGLERLGRQAFYQCASLRSVVIPGTVQAMGDYVFYECTGLREIVLEEGAGSFGKSFCYFCTNLQRAVIPGSAAAIGDYAFEGCSALTTVNLGEGIQSIGTGAFLDAAALSTLTLPSTVTAIRDYAFAASKPGTMSMKQLIFQGPKPTATGSDMFRNQNSSSLIIYSDPSYAASWNSDGNTVTWENMPLLTLSSAAGCDPTESADYEQIEYWDFETDPAAAGWSFVNADNNNYNWQWLYGNDSAQGYFSSGVLVTNYGLYNPVRADNWAVSPAIDLSGEENVFVSIHTRLLNNNASNENLAIYAGTSPDVNAMTKIGGDLSPTTDWTLHTASLASFSGQETVYVAIRQNSTYSRWMIGVDDVVIHKGEIHENDGLLGVPFCENLAYFLDYQSETLIITGSGPMPDYDNSANRAPWRQDNYRIKSVSLPEGLTYIGAYAFYACSLSKGLTLPASLSSIGPCAFGGSGLKSIALDPANTALQVVENVVYTADGATALAGPSGSGSLSFADGTTAIAPGAFFRCSASTVELPASVTEIGTDAFRESAALNQIYFFGSLTGLGDNAFRSCNSLSKAIFLRLPPENVGNTPFDNTNVKICYLGDYEEAWAPNGETQWRGYPLKRIYDIENPFCGDDLTWRFDADTGVLTLEGTGYMYQYAESSPPWAEFTDQITHLELPAGLTYIGISSLNGCDQLLSITVDPANQSYASDGIVLYNKNMTSLIIYPHGRQGTFVVPEGVSSIASNAFIRVTGLTGISFPSSLGSIGDYAFQSCTGLTDVVFPEGLTRIGVCAFDGCTGLTDVVFPESLTQLNARAFGGCTSLTDLVFPESLTQIDGEAFYGCTAISSVTFAEGLTRINTSTFEGCTSLTDVILPESLTQIGSSAFQNCTGLTYVFFGEKLLDIEQSAFMGCTSLEQVTFPKSLQYLRKNTFSGCSNLHWAYFKGTKPTAYSYGNDFSDCASDFHFKVRDVNWNSFGSDDGTWLGFPVEIVPTQYCGGNLSWEFNPYLGRLSIEGTGPMFNYNSTDNPAPWYQDASSITATVLPSGITSIGDWAFRDCAISELVLPASMEAVGAHAFDGCSSLQQLTVSSTLQSMGDGAFANAASLTDAIFRAGPPASFGTDVFAGCAGSFRIRYHNNFAYAWGGPKLTVWNGWPCRMYGDSCGTNLMYYVVAGVLEFVLIDETQPGFMTNFSSASAVPWNGISYSDIVLPEGLQNIGDYALQNQTNISSLQIPASIKAIGKNALTGCTALTVLNLPADLESVDYSDWYTLSALTAVNLAEGGSSPYCSLDGLLLQQGNQLTLVFCPPGLSDELSLPAGIQKIDKSALWRCSLLNSVIFPESLTYLEAGAIMTCVKLTSVTFLGDKPEVSASGYFYSGCSFLNTAYYKNAHAASWNADGNYRWQGLTLENIDTLNDPVTGDCGTNCHYTWYPLENRLDIWADEGSVGVMDAYASAPWGRYTNQINSLTVQGNVQNISQNAFYGYNSLNSVTLAEGVERIDSGAFRSCGALRYIRIPASVNSIGAYAFYGSLRDGAEFLGAPPSTFGSNVFNTQVFPCIYYHARYANDWAPNGEIHWRGYNITLLLEPLEGDCGEGVCYSYDPDTRTLRFIGSGAMTDYTASEEAPWAEVNNFIEHVVVESGVSSVGDCALQNLTNLADVSLADTVERIGSGAFQNCASLSGISLPASLNQLDADAFFGCAGLTAFQVEAGNQSYCAADGVLYSADGTRLIAWPAGKRDTSFEIPDAVQAICPAAFAGAFRLEEISIPDSVSEIGSEAFMGCVSLSEILLPGGLAALGSRAFAGCSNLATVFISGALPADVGEAVFLECSDELLILAAVDHDMGWYASGWTEWQGRPIIGWHMEEQLRGRCGDALVWSFDENTGLLTVSGIGDMDAEKNGWSKLEAEISSIRLREGVSSICDNAFSGLPQLRSVALPSTLERIGDCGLVGNGNLETLTLAESDYLVLQDDVLFSADGQVLYLCLPGKTGAYTIPEGTRSIVSSAFELCSSITEITLPDGVEELENWVFFNCASLEKLTALGAPPELVGMDIFLGCADDLRIWVSESWEALWDQGGGTWHGRPLEIIAEELPIADQAGENLSWSLEGGILSIQGAGPMFDFITFRPPWYEQRNEIREVRISEGVTSIGAKAFRRYPALHTLRMPDSLTAIGAQACFGCVSLGAIVIPANVQRIDDAAFASLDWTQNYGLIFLGGPPANMGAGVFENTSYWASCLYENGELWEEIAESDEGWNGLYRLKIVDVRLGDRVFLDYPRGKKYVSPHSTYVYGYGDMWDLEPGSSCEIVGSLEFSEGVTGIGSYAFCDFEDADWNGVYELELPGTLQRIGEFAFYGMLALQSISIPASVSEIGEGAFGLSPALQSITVDESNPVFAGGSVLHTKEMTRILRGTCGLSGNYAIPDSVTQIDAGALAFTQIGLLGIPASLTDLGPASVLGNETPFLLLPPTAEFEVDEANPSYRSVNGMLYNKDCTRLIRCPGAAAEATVEASVTAVGPSAFQYCDNLRSITFLGLQPEAVDESAFGWDGYSYLTDTTVYYLPEYAESWAPNGETEWLYGLPLAPGGDDRCGENVHWRYSKGVLQIFGSGDMYSYMDGDELLPAPWAEYAEEITALQIDEGVTGIGAGSFAGLSELESLYLADSLTHIDMGAFMTCAALTELALPENLVSIGEYAFAGAIHLESLSCSEALQQIGPYAFCQCGQIAELSFPASLAQLGEGAFNSCTGLLSARFAGPAPEAGADVFTGCDDGFCILADLAFADSWAPKGETSWQGWPLQLINWNALCGDTLSWSFDEDTGVLSFHGKGAMYEYNDTDNPAPWRIYKEQITALAIPDSVTEIGSYAFADCTALRSVTLPLNTRLVKPYAFRGCTELEDFVFSPESEFIYSYVFRGCTKLAHVSFPAALTHVAEGAFYGCASLSSADLGENLYLVGRWAFYGCSSLREVTLGPGLKVLDYYAFLECTALTRVVFQGPPPTSSNDYIFSGNSELVLYYSADYANAWAPNGETTWRVWPIALNPEADISTAPLQLTRLFYPNEYGLSKYEDEIYLYLGSETYAYLYSTNAYCQSDSFTAVFYRADDWEFTRNVQELGSISTDRLSEFASVEDAIFELGLKYAMPSDTPGDYWVYAEYTNSWNGKTHTASTYPVHVFVEDKSPEEYFRFDSETNTITGYYGTEETVVFPSEIGGVPVKHLDLSWFQNEDDLERGRPYGFRSVVFPDTLETIATYCFAKERYLGPDIVFPDSLHSIDSYAFYGTPLVKTLTFGSGETEDGAVQNISYGSGAFNRMSGLELVDMHAVLRGIACGTPFLPGKFGGFGSFAKCPNVKQLILPECGTAWLTVFAFNDAEELLDVENPGSVYLSVNETTFFDGIRHFASVHDRNYTLSPLITMLAHGREHCEADRNFVYYYDELQDGYTIASLRRDLTDGAGSLEFPASFNGKPIVRIGANNSRTGMIPPISASGLVPMDPDSIDFILEAGMNKNLNPRRVVIPQGVREIGWGAFRGMQNIQTLELPQSLKRIGSYAFYDERSSKAILLTDVNLNDCSLSYVGERAFYNAKLANFGDLDFIDGAYIGDYAFSAFYEDDELHTDNLSSITAHGSLNVGVGAFKNRWNLRSLEVSGALRLGQDAFDGCYWLENVSYQGEIENGDLEDEARGFSHFRWTLARPMVMESEKSRNLFTYAEIGTYAYRVYCRTGDWCYTRYYDASGSVSAALDAGNSDGAQAEYEWYPRAKLDLLLTLDEADIVIPSRITDELGEAIFTGVDLAETLRFICWRHPYSLYITDGIKRLQSEASAPSIQWTVPKPLSNCTGVRFSETLEEIPRGLFHNAMLACDVEIPASVTKIGALAFAGCQIGTLTLHEGLQEIGDAAFITSDADYDYHYNQVEMYYTAEEDAPRNVTRVVTAGRVENENDIQLPNSVRVIGQFAFAQTGIGGKFTPPAAFLGDGAFYRTGITELTMRASYTKLGEDNWSSSPSGEGTTRYGVFNGCPLTRIDLFDSMVGTLGISTFNNDIRTDVHYEETFDSASHTVAELKLPRKLQYVKFNALAGIDPGLLHFASGLKEFYVEYPTKTLNGRPVSEFAVTLPETIAKVHSSVFNLGSVTFYNQSPSEAVQLVCVAPFYNNDGLLLGYTFAEEPLPDQIPEGCLIRCYEGSFIHNWCLANNLSFELLPEQPKPLRLQVYGDDGKYFTDSDFSRIDWVDETTGSYLRFDTLSCPIHEFKSDHVYSVRVWLNAANYEIYDLDEGASLRFDPSAEDFEDTISLMIRRRQAVTVVGSFGDQRFLDGFQLYARSVKNDATTKFQDVVTTYPVTLNGDGSFSVQLPFTKVDLIARVSDELPYLPLTVKNIAYRARNSLGKIDLGRLSLPPEQIIALLPVSHPISGVTRIISADGSKYADGSINISDGRYFINLTALREEFSIGDTVIIQVTESSSAAGYAPYTLVLPGEKTEPAPITLSSVQNAKVILPARRFPIKLGAYDSYGRLAGFAATNSEFINELYLYPGSYTLVAFQNSGVNSLSLPGTLSEFLSASYGLAGYAMEEVTLSPEQAYEFSTSIPAYVVRSAVTVSFTEEPRLADREQGAYPVFLHYAVSNEARNGDISFRLETLDSVSTPFCQVDGAWAFFTGESGAKFEVTKAEGFLEHHLQVVTDAYEGAICFYVRPTGQALKLSINGEYKTSYVIPNLSFSVSKPREQAISRNGSVTLNYTNGLPGAVAKAYADGEEIGAAPLQVGAANKLKLDYTLPASEGETSWQLQFKVFDGAGTWLWSSYEFPVSYTDRPVPVPEHMEIRISNGNAAEDGVPRVTTASYNFATGESEKMKLLVLTENYLPNGTMAKDVEFNYYLHVQNPELVAYGEIYLKVWCCEEEPVIYNVTLRYNETSGTFDGRLCFEGGTRTVSELPYGFDLEVPTEKTQQEIEQGALDKANEWGDLLFAEPDPELIAFYETEADVDELRFFLENGEHLVGLTEEERQAFRDLTEEDIQDIIDLAEAKNAIAESYQALNETLNTKIPTVLSQYAQFESLNELFAAQGINAVQSIPEEGLTPGQLLYDGYQEYASDYGSFYIKEEADRTVITCLDPAVTFTLARDSHALNNRAQDRLEPQGSLDWVEECVAAFWAGYRDFQSKWGTLVSWLSIAESIVSTIISEGLSALADHMAEYKRILEKKIEIVDDYGKKLTVLQALKKKNLEAASGYDTLIKLGDKNEAFVKSCTEGRDKAKAAADHLSELETWLMDQINTLKKALRDGPSNLPRYLKALQKAKNVKWVAKAAGFLNGFANVAGYIFCIMDLMDICSIEFETLKREAEIIEENKDDIDGDILKNYCLRLYTGGIVIVGVSGAGVNEINIGGIKPHPNYPGDIVDYAQANGWDSNRLDANYVLYYAWARNPIESFMDPSSYIAKVREAIFKMTRQFHDRYMEYIHRKQTVVFVNAGIEFVSLASNLATNALGAALNVGGIIGSIGTTIYGSMQDENYEEYVRMQEEFMKQEIEPMRENSKRWCLWENNVFNMNQILHGEYIRDEESDIAMQRMYDITPKCCRNTLWNIGVVNYEYLEELSADYDFQEALEAMKNPYDFTDSDDSVPGDGEEPGYSACVNPQLDPSGYVYEAVASNRVDGAVASVFYRGADGSELPWLDAADYGEINPQITDSFGEYGWMTPLGRWRVRVEKEGYLPADSLLDPAADEEGWLPVPPPQLNVNIGLVSTAAPQVSTVAAAADRLQIVFSQYMSISDLEASPGLITVTERGENVPLCFTFADREESPTQEGVFYGRTLTVTRTDGLSFTGDALSLRIDAAFENYAGTPLASDYEARDIPVTQVVASVEHEYPYGYVGTVGAYTELAVTVRDTQGNPVAGENVTLSAAYGDLYQVENCSVVTDENGVAHFSVMALHDGIERFSFTTANGVSAELTASLVDRSPSAWKPDFADVAEDAWYHDAVYWAKENGITAGTSDTAFSPNMCCTRAQIVTYLWRANGSPEPTLTECPFQDVTANKYYYKAVLWATENGFTAGTSAASFSPNMACSRAQVVTFLWSTQGKPTPQQTECAFRDVPDNAWYRNAVLWAVENGITSGTSANAFSPNKACTRAEAVTFLWRSANGGAAEGAASAELR